MSKKEPPTLDASFAKLERAKRKLADFKVEVDAFCGSNLPTVRVHENYGAGLAYYIGKLDAQFKLVGATLFGMT